MEKVNFISVQEAIKKKSGKVSLRGWVYRERGSNKIKFIVLRDSSNIIQCVLEREKFETQWDEIDKLKIESSVEIHGKIKEDKRAPTGYEVLVDKIKIFQIAEEYPIGKDLNEKLLGDRRHLWLRSRKMTAILKIRSTLLFALHKFFRKNNFIEVEAPSFTASTSEGGSTTFEVSYFGKKAYLTQSWQFYAENIIHAVERAYAIAPSFRAEKSRTSRHLTEFWHCEVEAAWINLDDLIKLTKDCLHYVIEEVIKENTPELVSLGVNIPLLKKSKDRFGRIKYSEAIEKLNEMGHKIKYGEDFGAEEEKKLVGYFNCDLLFVTNYPLEILKFYHGEDLKNPGTGTNFNLLAKGLGEIVDGSQREENLDKIIKRLKKAKINLGISDWYLDSRRYGSVPHSGFGLGVERVIQWICGLENIKESIPFPRTPDMIYP
ncbi:asparagine--tRNA ligase [Patescibacteria group bacterium]|nr:asparagine--tRNA ligase [Patescibacteria group bacterium]